MSIPQRPKSLLPGALVGLSIVGFGVVQPDHGEHFYYMPDRPAEPPPFVRHEPPSAVVASNTRFQFPSDGRDRWA